MVKKQWVVYLVRCSDESLYCGITNNLKKRLTAHNSGRGAKYTKSRGPVKLVGTSSEMTKIDALKLEYRVKQVHASKKKIELTKGESNTMATNLKKELQAVSKEMKALQVKLEKITTLVGKAGKMKPKTSKAPAKKKIAPKKKVTKKKASTKKVTKQTKR